MTEGIRNIKIKSSIYYMYVCKNIESIYLLSRMWWTLGYNIFEMLPFPPPTNPSQNYLKCINKIILHYYIVQ